MQNILFFFHPNEDKLHVTLIRDHELRLLFNMEDFYLIIKAITIFFWSICLFLEFTRLEISARSLQANTPAVVECEFCVRCIIVYSFISCSKFFSLLCNKLMLEVCLGTILVKNDASLLLCSQDAAAVIWFFFNKMNRCAYVKTKIYFPSPPLPSMSFFTSGQLIFCVSVIINRNNRKEAHYKH